MTEPFPATMAGDASSGAAAMGSLGYSAAEVEGSGEWWWTCPVHTGVREARRARCPEDGCDHIMISMGKWTD